MATTNIMKHFQRVRMNIDQNLGRAEKSEVLSEELQILERRVEMLKNVCHNLHKKVLVVLRSSGPSSDIDKRLKKLPESGLQQCLLDASVQFGQDTGSGQAFHLMGNAEGALAGVVLGMETEIETKVVAPAREMAEVDYPSIQKLKKQLTTRALDMDTAKARYASLRERAQPGMQAKMDEARLELEDCMTKVEQTKDQLATEMYNFVSKESDLNKCLEELTQIQVNFHRAALNILEPLIPQIQENIAFTIKRPVFGQSLVEHLESDNRELSIVLEECIAVLNEFALEEEGLFRIAGSASRIKKLKAAFNSAQQHPVLASEEDVDLHVISSVLKLYLRELPEPLMCTELYHDWFQALQKPADSRLSSLRDVVNRMPKPNYTNFRFLIKFLAKLSEYSEVNKMSASNISLVIAPNLLWANGESGPNMMMTGLQSNIVEILIANANYFFPGTVDFSCGRQPLGTPTTPHSSGILPSANSGSGPQLTQPIGSMTTNILSGFVSPESTSDGSASSSASPGTLKRAPKKPPAPLPPPGQLPSEGLPLHPMFGKSLSTGSPGYASGGGNGAPRLSIPEPIPSNGSTPSPGKDRPSSPTRIERPKLPPPERPQIPPPEKPMSSEKPASAEKPVFSEKPTIMRDKPGARSTIHLGQTGPEKPTAVTKPNFPGTTLYPSLVDIDRDQKTDSVTAPAHHGHVRQSSYGGSGARPPRPQPPPPPASRP